MAAQNSTQPLWVSRLLDTYQAGIAHAFILHFNTGDYVSAETPVRLVSYLGKLLAQRDVIAIYSRDKGINFPTETMRQTALNVLGMTKDQPQSNPALSALQSIGAAPTASQDFPRSPDAALQVLNKLLRTDTKAAVIIENAELIVPDGPLATMSPEDRTALATISRWGHDPDIVKSGNPVILITGNLTALHSELRAAGNRYEAIQMPLPDTDARRVFLKRYLSERTIKLAKGLNTDKVANATAGLSLLHVEDILLRAEATGKLSQNLIWERKEDIIRSEFGDVLEIIEPRFGFADVGGLEHVKRFFERSVIRPIHEDRKSRVPMGVLLTGPAGCLAKGTPVLMFDGTIKNVEDVQAGDMLMGPNSEPRKVLKLARGEEMMYRISPVKGDSYTVNQSHILSLKMSYRAGWHKKGEIVNLTVNDYLDRSKTFKRAAKGWRTGIDFEYQDVDIEPYMMGLWLGDGSSYTTWITTADHEIENYLNEFAQRNKATVNIMAQRGKARTFSITSLAGNGMTGGDTSSYNNIFRKSLQSLNLLENKHLPHCYKANSRQVRLEVLAGLIDSDGSLSCSGYEYSTKLNSLADDVLFLSRSLGFAAYKKTKMVNGNLYWRIFISGDVSEIPVKVKRKKANPRLQKKDVLVTGIKKIEALGVDTYYGFELDQDRLFLLGDFTVTHNTGKSIMAEAVAQEAGVNAVRLRIGGQIASKWQGEGERNLEKALRAIEGLAPTIVFIDEIDQAISRGNGGGNEQNQRIFQRLLEFMSDTGHRGDIVFLAATNRPDLMDAALRRPGRFDKKIPFLVPDADERKAIFEVMARRYLGQGCEVSEDTIEATEGWTGAEIEAVAVKAAELVEDENLDGCEAINQAVGRLSPSTADIELMTYLAVSETNDSDLLPPRYKELLKNRTELDQKIEQVRETGTPRGRREL